MENVNNLIEIIGKMDNCEKLKLAVRINESNYTPLSFNREEKLKYYEEKLANMDEEYKKFPVITSTYIAYIMAKISELDLNQRNQVAMYLFNILEKV